MKIGFDAKRLFNNFTGLGNHSRTTLDILTNEFPNNEYYLYTPKVNINDITEPYINKIGCKTIKPTGLLKGSIWRTYGLVSNIESDKLDLFHGLSNELPHGIEKSGIPSIVTIHDVAFKTFTDMYHFHDRVIYDIKWKYACKSSNRIIAISECTKADIIKFYNVPEDKIDVVYQPVSPLYYKPIERSTEKVNPYMLYVGSINSRKNLLGIVKAMELLPKDLQIPLMVVGGGGEYKQKVQQYIVEHKMENLFIWPNNVYNEDLRKLYSNASLFIYPSFYEGFGLPVVEAQLSGCPVITSNISSLPEAGGPHSIKVDPYNVEEISNAIIKVLTDDEVKNKMIEGGREYSMNTFHPSVLANNLMNVYRKVL